MRPVKTHIPATELYRKNDDVSEVGLGYKRNAFNFFKIPGSRKGNPNAVAGIRAVGKQVVALYGADSKVLDPELFIFRENVVRCRREKGFGMDREGQTIIAVGPADDGAAVVPVRSKKHYVPVIVFNNPGIMNSGYRVGDVIPGKNGIPVISPYKGFFAVHALQPYH
jgi:hypothetical protein